MRDFHAHSNYSDGDFLHRMVGAAESAGLDGLGFADHCNVSKGDVGRDNREALGFNLDLTYERRRRGIERTRENVDIDVYDAVEMDYDPDDEEAIREFLDDAGFDYAIGSVHSVSGLNVQNAPAFEGKSDGDLDALVDGYFEKLVALAESELFEVAAHVDLVERTPALRGRATGDHYHRVARALSDSRTVPEINAGRALTDAGIVHPGDEFLDALIEHGVAFTVGSDAHYPDEVGGRVAFLADFFADHGLDRASPLEIAE